MLIMGLSTYNKDTVIQEWVHSYTTKSCRGQDAEIAEVSIGIAKWTVCKQIA
jgi:hypothetical protein